MPRLTKFERAIAAGLAADRRFHQDIGHLYGARPVGCDELDGLLQSRGVQLPGVRRPRLWPIMFTLRGDAQVHRKLCVCARFTWQQIARESALGSPVPQEMAGRWWASPPYEDVSDRAGIWWLPDARPVFGLAYPKPPSAGAPVYEDTIVAPELTAELAGWL